MTFQFDHVTTDDVGEWQGEEQRAADYLNHLNALLAELASKKFPDPTTEQEYAVKDLANRFFFEDLCNEPDNLKMNDNDRRFYVFCRLNDIE